MKEKIRFVENGDGTYNIERVISGGTLIDMRGEKQPGEDGFITIHGEYNSMPFPGTEELQNYFSAIDEFRQALVEGKTPSNLVRKNSFEKELEVEIAGLYEAYKNGGKTPSKDLEDLRQFREGVTDIVLSMLDLEYLLYSDNYD